MRALFLAVVVLSFCNSVVQGALILEINSIDKTFAFTGSATGTPDQFGLNSALTSWALIGIGGTVENPNDFFYDNDVAFSTTVGTPGGEGLDTSIRLTPNIAGTFSVMLVTPTDASQTLTGTGVFQSYASLGLGSQLMLESTIGQTADLFEGFGFGSLSIQAAAATVPEPSSFLLLSLSVTGFSLLHRRRNLERNTEPQAKASAESVS